MEGFDGAAASGGGQDAYSGDLAVRLERCGRFLVCWLGKRRGQEKILRILQENDGISQKQLQEQLSIQPGSMSEIAAKLEAKGLISRGRDEADRRKILLSITELGRDWLARQNAEHIRQRQAEWFSALTEEEQATLGAMLDKLAADWARRYEEERRDRRQAGSRFPDI